MMAEEPKRPSSLKDQQALHLTEIKMASIEDLMRSVNKKSLFGHVSPDYVKTAKSERKEQERRMSEQIKQRDAEQRKLQEEEQKRQREDHEYEMREYEEYNKTYQKRGIFRQDHDIYRNEQHVRHLMRQGREHGIYSNQAQKEIWQPGSSARYSEYGRYASANSTYNPVVEHSQEHSPDTAFNRAEIESPVHPIEDLSVSDEPDISLEECTPKTTSASSKPRRSRVAANFTNKILEEGVVEKATKPRRSSWRDAPSTASISDLRPDRRVIHRINNHLSSAQDEFQLRSDDFPPIGKGKKY